MNGSAGRPADWQLPPGVNHGLWDYLHSEAVAQNYDAYLSGSSLPQVDVEFVLARCVPGGKLLDLGCGTGRLAVAAARRGQRVLGIDLSEAMLAAAAEKARTAGVDAAFVRANLVELDCLASTRFDTAACLFSTLGMMTDPAARRRIVRQAWRLLRPGGLFILHVHNRWFNVWQAGGRAWLLRDAFRWLRGAPAVGDCAMPAHQGLASLTLHLFSRREAVRLLRSEGFRVRQVQALSLRSDGQLLAPWWFGALRAYGYLIVAERPRCESTYRGA